MAHRPASAKLLSHVQADLCWWMWPGDSQELPSPAWPCPTGIPTGAKQKFSKQQIALEVRGRSHKLLCNVCWLESLCLAFSPAQINSTGPIPIQMMSANAGPGSAGLGEEWRAGCPLWAFRTASWISCGLWAPCSTLVV